MRKEILIRGHLGLGDGLVINGLVRHYAVDHEVSIVCKPHNQISLAFMYRDDPKISLVTTENEQGMIDDDFADAACRHVKDHGKKVLLLGMYGDRKKYNAQSWDNSMYDQAGVPFDNRWNDFRCSRQPSCELVAPKDHSFVFVHDDASRGFAIPEHRLPQRKPIIRPSPGKTDNIFAYWDLIEHAEEIHMIDSSFAILADSLPDLKAKKLVVHLYARKGALPPRYRKDWDILKS
jgi:hypothetical protein